MNYMTTQPSNRLPFQKKSFCVTCAILPASDKHTMYENLQDTDIISLVLQGQQKPFAVLVDRYRHYVFTITMQYINSREEAEEVAQDVFIKVYRSLAGFNGKSKFSTWLYTIVHHTCLSHLRKRKHVTIPVDTGTDNLFIAGEKASDKTYNRSVQSLIDKAISLLEKPDAEVIILFYLAEQSLDEIAAITGQPANNIKVRLFRARQKLRDILQKHYPAELATLK